MAQICATTRFINGKKHIQLVQMAQSSRRRFLKIRFKRTENNEKSTNESNAALSKPKSAGNLEAGFPAFDKPEKSKQSSSSLQRVSGGRLARVKIAGKMPPRSRLNVFSRKSVKSQNVGVGKLPARNAGLLGKEVSCRGTVSESFMQKENVSGRFLSVLIGKGRLIKYRVAAQLLGRKVWGDADNAKHLSHARRIQLFQALLNEQLTYLDLHGRFGVSKQTIRRLVKNGLLKEDWGPKAIGVRFRLSKKGKTYLKELEAAALYKSKVGQKNLIRLKSKS